jgi:hypothetical protein
MKRPDHFFVGSMDGCLYDTRQPDWNQKPLRWCYERPFPRIDTIAQLKATLRHGEYAWPGGYQMYFIAADGAPLSFDTVRKEWRNVLSSMWGHAGGMSVDDSWRVVGCDINYEDNELYCAHTNERIPAAYEED